MAVVVAAVLIVGSWMCMCNDCHVHVHGHVHVHNVHAHVHVHVHAYVHVHVHVLLHLHRPRSCAGEREMEPECNSESACATFQQPSTCDLRPITRQSRSRADHWKSILAPLTLSEACARNHTLEPLGVGSGLSPPSMAPSGRPGHRRAPPANLQ